MRRFAIRPTRDNIKKGQSDVGPLQVNQVPCCGRHKNQKVLSSPFARSEEKSGHQKTEGEPLDELQNRKERYGRAAVAPTYDGTNDVGGRVYCQPEVG